MGIPIIGLIGAVVLTSVGITAIETGLFQKIAGFFMAKKIDEENPYTTPLTYGEKRSSS